jgi:hypothetical protein
MKVEEERTAHEDVCGDWPCILVVGGYLPSSAPSVQYRTAPGIFGIGMLTIFLGTHGSGQ